MKHTSVLLIVFSLCTLFSLSAQNRTDEQRRKEFENLRAQRIAFFTKEIGLTAEEAKEFWPVSNELDQKKFELNRNLMREIRNVREAQKAGKDISDAEYDRLINLMISSREKELELDKEYLKKIQKILSPEKVFKYLRSELQFAREALSPAPPHSGRR
jgi:Spy/CpxP family protein refolding chaperone